MSVTMDVLRYIAGHNAVFFRDIVKESELGVSAVEVALRCLKRRGFVKWVEGLYGLTEKGLEYIKQGREIKCGPERGEAASSRGNTLRQRAWKVMHMRRVFTLADLLVVLCDEASKKDEENLGNYLKALYKAGLLKKAARTGHYILSEGDGPLAPAYNRQAKTVTDRNTGQVYHV